MFDPALVPRLEAVARGLLAAHAASGLVLIAVAATTLAGAPPSSTAALTFVAAAALWRLAALVAAGPGIIGRARGRSRGRG
jgi:hypothetical protein